MKLRQAFLLAALAESIAGCGQSATETPAASGQIKPLVIGNVWLYRYDYLLPNGRPDTEATGTPTGSITEAEAIEAKMQFGPEWNYATNHSWFAYDAPVWYYVARADGLWVHETSWMGFDTMYHTVVYPVPALNVVLLRSIYGVTVTDSLTRLSTTDSEEYVETCVALDTVVRVAAGTFHCVHYRGVTTRLSSGLINNWYDEYWAVGVGEVCAEERVLDPSGNTFVDYRASLLWVQLYQ